MATWYRLSWGSTVDAVRVTRYTDKTVWYTETWCGKVISRRSPRNSLRGKFFTSLVGAREHLLERAQSSLQCAREDLAVAERRLAKAQSALDDAYAKQGGTDV